MVVYETRSQPWQNEVEVTNSTSRPASRATGMKVASTASRPTVIRTSRAAVSVAAVAISRMIPRGHRKPAARAGSPDKRLNDKKPAPVLTEAGLLASNVDYQ